MKNKKNRKQTKENNPKMESSNKMSVNLKAPFKVQFDVLRNDISCFIGQNRNIADHICTKTSSNILAQNSFCQFQSNSSLVSTHLTDNKSCIAKDQTQSATDLIRQSSNTILSKIEQKGIRFDWQEQEQVSHLQKQKQDQDDDDCQTLWSAFSSSFQKSFASTNDFVGIQQSSYMPWQDNNNASIFDMQYDNGQLQAYNQNPYGIQSEYICRDWRTTIMIRNIPNKYTITQLAAQIDTQHSDTYDFLYLPCDSKNQCNVGYGFINFVTTSNLHSFYLKFDKYIWKRYRSQKICSLTYARLQGLNQLIQHFQNSKVLNQKQKKYRPIIKYQQIQKMVLLQQKQ